MFAREPEAMNIKDGFKMLMTLAAAAFLAACGPGEPPLDANGQTPEQVLLETYVQIVEGNFDQARNHFSPQFIDEFVTSKSQTFEQYCSNTAGWKTEWLKTKLVGNDYNDDIWRAKVIPDEGKGAENGPGIVHDFHLIDGVWKIVYWNHYPKS